MISGVPEATERIVPGMGTVLLSTREESWMNFERERTSLVMVLWQLGHSWEKLPSPYPFPMVPFALYKLLAMANSNHADK